MLPNPTSFPPMVSTTTSAVRSTASTWGGRDWPRARVRSATTAPLHETSTTAARTCAAYRRPALFGVRKHASR